MSGTIVLIAGIAILAAIAGGAAWQSLKARRNARGRNRRGVLLQLRPSLELTISPTDQKGKTVTVLEQFLRYVDGWRERMEETEPAYSLEVHATGAGGYGFYLWTTAEDAKLMATTLGSKYELPYEVPAGDEPMARFAEKLADERGYPRIPNFYTGEFRLTAPAYLPIREWQPAKDSDDPMEGIYGILDAFRDRNGVAGFILTCKPADRDWREDGLAHLKSMEFGIRQPSTPGERLRSMGEPDPVPKKQQLDAFKRDELAAVTGKMKQHAFEAVIRIYSTNWEVYQLLRDAVERRFRGDYNGIGLASYPVSLHDMAGRWFDRSDMVLTPSEIASICHFPDSRTQAGRLHRGSSRTALPPEGLPTIREGSRTDIFSLLDGIGVER